METQILLYDNEVRLPLNPCDLVGPLTPTDHIYLILIPSHPLELPQNCLLLHNRNELGLSGSKPIPYANCPKLLSVCLLLQTSIASSIDTHLLEVMPPPSQSLLLSSGPKLGSSLHLYISQIWNQRNFCCISFFIWRGHS